MGREPAHRCQRCAGAGPVTGPAPAHPGSGGALHVLVVEDDPAICRSLVLGLTRAGYRAQSVGTGHAALAVAPSPAVILLDLGLPDIDGIDLCRRLRARSDAAIIVLTCWAEEKDRVTALDGGADDYLLKPFGLAELLARIRAVLRRNRTTQPDVLRHGPLTVVPRTRTVTVAGREVPLTPKEFDILICLANGAGRMVTRQEILERAWNARWYGPMKVLDVHIAALRRKLGVPGLVTTVYGRGFRLDEPSGLPDADAVAR